MNPERGKLLPCLQGKISPDSSAKESHRVGYTKYQQTVFLQTALAIRKLKLDSLQPFKVNCEGEVF